MGKKHTTDVGAEQSAAADASAFRAAVRDVKPLAQLPLAQLPLAQLPLAQGLAAPKPRARLRKARVEAADNIDELMPLVAAASNEDSGSSPLSFQRAGVRTQVMRRLRRGLYPAEDELDLHGMNQAAARDQLADFIVRSRDSGRRCVRIIHGKGYRSGARGPVLKTAVNLWLRRHIDVMAFTSARAIDGGTGAVYVLLRA
jgi:DNA-nicking Smr family endonuclease